MALKSTYDTVKQAIQDVIAPQLQELRGEIAGLKGEMSGLRGEIHQLERRMEEGFTNVNRRIDEGLASVNRRIDDTNKRLDEAINIRERLAAVEARIRVTEQ